MILSILNFLSNIFHFGLHLGFQGSFPSALSKKDEAELVKKMLQGDEKAKEKLIEHNLRLVAHVIKKYYSQSVEQEDLISIGTIGLIKGINSYNPEKNSKLATYVGRCIENEILMYFRSQKKNSLVVSMDEPLETDSNGNALTLMELVSTEDTIADDIDLLLKKEKLYGFIEGIDNHREKEIIIRRYGLYETEPLTQKEIAEMMGISRSYVSRIEKKVIEYLRESFVKSCGD